MTLRTAAEMTQTQLRHKRNWDEDFCTKNVRSSCEEILVGAGITAGVMVVTWGLVTLRGRQVGAIVKINESFLPPHKEALIENALM